MTRAHGGWARLATCGICAALAATACSSKSGSKSEDEGAVGSNTFVTALWQPREPKLDLLFVIDNSPSMADKQALLAQAVPLLMQRLITPRCVEPCTSDDCTPQQQANGIPVGGNADAEGNCVDGAPEMPSLRDIHVGVISSSLGSHGATGDAACIPAAANDHAHLLGEVRGLPGSYDNAGFLAWDPGGRYSPAGEANLTTFTDNVASHILAAGESGCEYEATLESWYRFLVDPEPPLRIVLDQSRTSRDGIDETLLAQRAAFLRPDSLVSIVMLTDENDCSVVDEGYGWLVTNGTAQFRSTSACAANPNDRCCQSCGEATTEEGCAPIAQDVECQKGMMLEEPQDHPNLRCWQQKRRFGFDLLYPIARYAEALRSPLVMNASEEPVPNPLFAASEGGAPRDRSYVLLTGIVGVPWQDLADEQSLEGPGLRYLTANELDLENRWDFMLGDPSSSPPILPMDPFMVETPFERVGQNPVVGAAHIVPAASNDPTANPINGHEQVNVDDSDLQYACTFPLLEPRTCDDAAASAGVSCDCYAEDAPRNRPLCQPEGGGAADTVQYYAKAYPGLRHLSLLKEAGESAIVASICPKVVDSGSPDYGYNPAVDAMVERFSGAFGPLCFPRPLPVADDGSVPCTVVEARANLDDCDCEADGRTALKANSQAAKATQDKMAEYQLCDIVGGPSCASLCLCELPQLTGDNLSACQAAPQPEVPPGYCYVSAQADEPQIGDPALVQSCPASARRLLRLVGGAPLAESQVMLVCDDIDEGPLDPNLEP